MTSASKTIRIARRPPRLRLHDHVAILSAALTMAVATVTVGQWKVNNQIYGNSGPSVKYGWGPGYQSYPTSVPMRSEVRYSIAATGTTRSEYRMNQGAIGPLAPRGASAYVSAPGPRYTVGSVGTVGNYVSSQPGPPGSTFMTPPAGSVRYAPAAATPGYGAVRVPSATPSSLSNSAALFPSMQTTAAQIPRLQFTPQSIGSVRYGS
jgi:hypothetical protein